MNATRLHTILALTTMTVVCHAAEPTAQKNTVDGHGIRVAIRNAPGVDEFEEDFGSGSVTTRSLEEEQGIQVDVMYVRRHMGEDGKKTIGPMWGAGVFLVNGTSGKASNGDKFELSAFGVIGEGGVAAQLGDKVVLELLPFLGVGSATQDITGFESGNGAYFLYGIKGGIFFKVTRSIELGLEAGYSGFTSTGEIDYPGNTSDIKFTGGGFQGGLVGVYKF